MTRQDHHRAARHGLDDRAPEPLDPSAMVEIDEEIHHAQETLRRDSVEGPDLPVAWVDAHEVAQESAAAQDPDREARIVRVNH
jgi:hypothetical protein